MKVYVYFVSAYLVFMYQKISNYAIDFNVISIIFLGIVTEIIIHAAALRCIPYKE